MKRAGCEVRPLDYTMRLRLPLVLALSVGAGLFWSLGSDASAVVIHFIGPILVVVLVVLLWRATPWQRQLLLILGLFLLAETVRLVSYGFRGGWRYIAADSETQLWLVVSIAVQVIVGLLAFGAARFFIPRDETRVV